MRRLLVVTLLALGLGLAQPFTVQDARGQTVAVRSIERIVSLNGVTTEILFALGVGDKVVLGEREAFHLGVHLEPFKRQAVALSALAVGTAVALSLIHI